MTLSKKYVIILLKLEQEVILMNRPIFEEIHDYNEFRQYFWYREELSLICRNLDLNSTGNKEELQDNIKEYFNNKSMVH